MFLVTRTFGRRSAFHLPAPPRIVPSAVLSGSRASQKLSFVRRSTEKRPCSRWYFGSIPAGGLWTRLSAVGSGSALPHG